MYKMSDIIFKDVSLTKRAPAWKFFHANEEKRLAKCQIGNCSEGKMRNSFSIIFQKENGSTLST